MTDIAALGLKVEGIQELERLLAAMEKLEKQQGQTEKSQNGLNEQQKQSKKPLEDSKKATEQLTEADRRLAEQAHKAGMSVNELKNNLRGLPAQFTDIAVSLQGGQAPLTVFLQQGGQLKDMFNGAGNAARAMGGYVTSLINPLSLAATAVAALGVAYYQGSKEADAFRVSLATTGNAIGTTTDALTIYSRQIAEAGETQGKAAESLNVFVAAGFKSEEQLAQFTRTAIAWERATGEGVDSVAEKFVALEKDPLKAAMKLQESMNFLTVDIYKQIKALEDQGDKLGAAALAMGSYEEAMKRGTKTILENMGYLEYSAYVVTTGFKGMWDMVAGIGRPDPKTDQLAEAYERLNNIVMAGVETTPAGQAAAEKQREIIKTLEAGIAATKAKTEAEKQNAIAVKELDEFNKEYGKYLKEELTLNQSLKKAREDAKKQKLSEAETTKLLNGITEEYNKKNKVRVTSTKAIENSYRTLAERAAEYVKSLELEAQQGEKISKSQQLEIELKSLIIRGKGKGTDAAVASTKALIAEAKAMETQAKARKAMEEAAEQYQKDLDDLAEYQQKEDEAVAKQAQATYEAGKALENESRMLELQTGLIGASTQARELAIEKLRIQIELEKELDALDNDKALPSDRREEAKAAARERAVQRGANAEKKILIDSYNEIGEYVEDALYDAIVTGGASAGEALERMFKNLVLQPIVKAGVQDLMNLVGLGGGGQGGGSNLMSLASNLYSSFSGQNPVLNSIGSFLGIGGGISSASSAALAASAADLSLAASQMAGSTALEVASAEALAASAADLSAAGGASSAGGAGSFAAAWPAAIFAGMLASNKLFSAGYSARNFDTSQKVGDIGNYFQTSTLAPIVGERIANVLTGAPLAQYIWKGASKALGISGGTPHAGAASQYAGGQITAGGKQFTRSAINADYTAGLQSSVDSLAFTLGSTLDGLDKIFGGQGGFSVTTGFKADSDDPSNATLQISNAVGDTLVKWLAQRSGEFGSRATGQSYDSDPEQGFDEYLKAITAATIPQFKAIVPQWADAMLDSFGQSIGFSGNASDWESISVSGADAMQALQQVAAQIAQFDAAIKNLGETIPMFANLSDDMVSQMIAAAGGSIDTFGNVINGFYDAFTSEADKFAHVSQRLQDATGIDPRLGQQAADQFKATVEQAIAAGNGALAIELMALAPAFKQATEEAKRLGPALSEVMKGLIEEQASLDVEMLRATGDTEGYKAALRALAIDGYSEAEIALWDLNTATQAHIEKLDLAAEKQREIDAQRYGLEGQILQLMGDTAALRARELELIDPTNRALQERIYALQDEATATQAAAEASRVAEAAQQQLQQTASSVLQSHVSLTQEHISALQSAINEAQGKLGQLTSNRDWAAEQAGRAYGQAGAQSTEFLLGFATTWEQYAGSMGALADGFAGLEAAQQAEVDELESQKASAEAQAKTWQDILNAENQQLTQLMSIETAIGVLTGAVQSASSGTAAGSTPTAEEAAQKASLVASTNPEALQKLIAEAAFAANKWNDSLGDDSYTDVGRKNLEGVKDWFVDAVRAALPSGGIAKITDWLSVYNTSGQVASNLADLMPKAEEPAAESATAVPAGISAMTIAEYRQLSQMQQQYWQLLGDEESIRKATLASMHPMLHAMQEQLWAIEDQKKAAEEAAAAMRNAQDGAWANLDAAVEREKTYWQEAASASKEAISSLSSTLGLLTSNAKDLYGTIDSAQQMQAAVGMVYIEDALEKIKVGASAADFEGLGDAISSARSGLIDENYATALEQQRDTLILANQMSEIGALTEEQLTSEEKSLLYAEQQITSLDEMLADLKLGIENDGFQIDATLSVRDAIYALSLTYEDQTTQQINAFSQALAQFGASYSSKSPESPTIPAADDSALQRESRSHEGYRLVGNSLYFPDDNGSHTVAAKDIPAMLDYYGLQMSDVDGSHKDGLARVPRDGYIAKLHKDEAVVPAQYNPFVNGGSLNSGVETLLMQIISDNRSQASSTIRLQSVVARIVERWNLEGLPQERNEAPA